MGGSASEKAMLSHLGRNWLHGDVDESADALRWSTEVERSLFDWNCSEDFRLVVKGWPSIPLGAAIRRVSASTVRHFNIGFAPVAADAALATSASIVPARGIEVNFGAVIIFMFVLLHRTQCTKSDSFLAVSLSLNSM
jgi:hypothetical protein